MAFELLFGENAVPGSADVYRHFLELHDRVDVENFCRRIRIKAAGGEEAVEERRKRVEQLERTASEAKKAGRYEEAYHACVEGAEILGDYNFTLGLLAAQVLLSLNRPKEAIALAFSIDARFDDDNIMQVIWEGYQKLGYELPENEKHRFSANSTTGPLKQFDENDLNLAIDRLKDFDSDKNWDYHLFPVLHILYHLKQWKPRTKSVFKRRINFIATIKNNATLVALFTGLNFATSSVAELRFFAWLVHLLSGWVFAADDGHQEKLISQSWYRHFLQTFGQSLVTKKALVRMASMQPGYAEDIIFGWFAMAAPVYMRLRKDGKNGILFKPFDDLSFYASICSLFIFGGVKFGAHHPDEHQLGAAEIPSHLLEMMLELLDNKIFQRCTRAISKDQLPKTIDLLLLAFAISFAEWRYTLFFKDVVDFPACDVEPATNSLVLQHLYPIFSLIIVKFQDIIPPTLFLGHVSYFVTLAQHIDFAVQFEEVTEKVIEAFVFLSSQIGLFNLYIRDFSQLKGIANCEEFCSRFIRAFPKYLSIVQRYPVDAMLRSDEAIAFVGNLASVSKSSCFSKILFSEESASIPLLNFAFDNKTSPPRLLATLLRNADPKCRRRWASNYQGPLLKFASYLLKVIIKSADLLFAGDCVNFLLAFHGLIGREPVIVPLASVLKESKTSLDQVERLFRKICQAVECFTTIAKMPPLQLHQQAAGQVMMMIGSLATALLVTVLTQQDARCQAIMKNDTACRRNVLANLRKHLVAAKHA